MGNKLPAIPGKPISHLLLENEDVLGLHQSLHVKVVLDSRGMPVSQDCPLVLSKSSSLVVKPVLKSEGEKGLINIFSSCCSHLTLWISFEQTMQFLSAHMLCMAEATSHSWPVTCLQFHSSWFVCHYQKNKEKFITHSTKPFILHTQLESCTKLYVHRLTVILSKLSLERASCIPGGHELPLYSRTDSSALVGTWENVFLGYEI